MQPDDPTDTTADGPAVGGATSDLAEVIPPGPVATESAGEAAPDATDEDTVTAPDDAVDIGGLERDLDQVEAALERLDRGDLDGAEMIVVALAGPDMVIDLTDESAADVGTSNEDDVAPDGVSDGGDRGASAEADTSRTTVP